MTYSKSSALKEGAFRKERLSSFFLFGISLIFLLSSCRSMEDVSSGSSLWVGKRGEKQMARIRNEKRLVFAVVKEAAEEKSITLLAGKAASLLGMRLETVRTEAESIPALLRSGRVDFAWAVYSGKEEVFSLFLLPLVIGSGKEKYIFALPPAGKLWKKMLKDALSAAAAKGGKDG